MKVLAAVLLLFAVSVPAFGQDTKTTVTPTPTQGCLIVRQSEGHRFRNSMVAGFLTGGVGFVAGGAFGGGKFTFVDSVGYASKKMRYTGGELQQLQNTGVHIIVVGKKADGEEIQTAREVCTTPPTTPPPSK